MRVLATAAMVSEYDYNTCCRERTLYLRGLEDPDRSVAYLSG